MGIGSLFIFAEMGKGKLRKKISELKLAMEGKLEEHHRILRRLQLDRID